MHVAQLNTFHLLKEEERKKKTVEVENFQNGFANSRSHMSQLNLSPRYFDFIANKSYNHIVNR